MTRGRKKHEAEVAREWIETDLAKLGNARVYLRLVSDRLESISLHAGLVTPAIEDLRRAELLIRQVQARIAARAFGEELQ